MSVSVWLLFGLAVLLLELILPGFIIIFFGIGAWITALAAWLGVRSLDTQLVVFLVSSLVSLFLLRRTLQGILQGRVSQGELTDASLDDFLGHRARVVAAIEPDSLDGRVEFRGTQWAATAEVPIPVGETVRIEAKDNLTLRVKCVER